MYIVQYIYYSTYSTTAHTVSAYIIQDVQYTVLLNTFTRLIISVPILSRRREPRPPFLLFTQGGIQAINLLIEEEFNKLTF